MPAHGEGSRGTVRFGGPRFAPLAILRHSPSSFNNHAAAVVLDLMTASGHEWLSVWFNPLTAGAANQLLGQSRWRTWKSNSVNGILSEAAEAIAQAREDVAGVPGKAGLKVILKGQGWVPGTKSVLQQAMTASDTLHDNVDSVISDHAVPLRMAREAREILTGYFACNVPGPEPEGLEEMGRLAEEDREL